MIMKRKLQFLFKHKESIIEVLVLLSIYAFLLYYFKPSLIFLDTTISGGDTGSHNYLWYYLKSYLLPKRKLIGWTPDWYAGLPLFQYYFVFPYLLTLILDIFFPLNISFKIVTVLGTFLMPIATFLSMKLMNFRFPIPILASVFILSFLFMEANSMWGGNIPSTLAGEFSYSLSLSLTILFFGTFYNGLKHGNKIILNSLIFWFIMLTHVYTTIFTFVSSCFLLLTNDKREFIRRLKYSLKCYGISFLLIGFWLVPLFFKMNYHTPFDFIWIINNIKEVFPEILIPFFSLAFIGILISIKEKDGRIWFISFSVLVSFLLYKLSPLLRVTDIRFIPFLQLFPIFIASYAVAKIVNKIKISHVFVIVIIILAFIWTKEHVTFIDFWIKWNYEGFENKPHWSQLNNMTTYLAGLPYGRVVHEFSSSHDKFGTPRTLELIPFFTGKPVLEGLTIESGVSAPYVFWIQSEISETPTCPLPRMRCSSFNLENGIKHLKMFNVDYLVATSDKLKNAARNNKECTFLKSFNEIEIYKLNNTGKYVVLPEYEPILVKTKDWKKTSLELFKNMDVIDVPFVFVKNIDKKTMNDFKFVVDDKNLSAIKKIPLNASCDINESVTNEEIRINTSCIGKPLWIKVSYFPNWKVEGANKIYLASPSFMLIFPEKSEVRLYYGSTIWDVIGNTLTLVGICIIIFYLLSKKFSNFLTTI